MFVGFGRPQAGFQKREAAPYVSINRRGEIVLNRAAWKLLAFVNYVQLFYDAETKQIGIARPNSHDFSLETFTLRRWGRGGRLRVIRVGRFLKQLNIEIKETHVFTDITLENGLMILDLRDAFLMLPNSSV